MNVFHLLTMILLVAKLAGYFSHSWWLVFLPSLVSIGLGLVIILFVIVVGVLTALLEK